MSILIQFVAYLLTYAVFAATGQDYYAGLPTGTQFIESVRAYPLVVGTSLVPPVLIITAVLLAIWIFCVLKTRKVRSSGWIVTTYVSAGILGTFWGVWFQLLMSGV